MRTQLRFTCQAFCEVLITITLIIATALYYFKGVIVPTPPIGKLRFKKVTCFTHFTLEAVTGRAERQIQIHQLKELNFYKILEREC